MKKLIVFILTILLTGTLFAQNTFKYEVRANGGLRVGGSTFAEIDSITLQAGKLRIMTGATLQKIAGHVLYTDTATMLTKYARKASPTFTGVVKLATDTLATRAYARANGGSGTPIDTTSLSSRIDLKLNVSDTAAMLAHYALLSEIGTGGDISTLEMRVDSIVDVLADSINIEALLQIDFDTDTLAKLSDVRSLAGSGVVGVTLNSGTLTLTGSDATADDITFYTNGNGEYNLPTGGGNLTIQSQVQAWIADSLNVLRTADSDTIPLFVFGLGSGHSSDTAIFNNGRLAGAFYNSGSDTLYVTELRGVLVEGTGTETIAVQVSWDVNMKDATPTNLNTTALTVTNMTTGTVDTSFDNNGIPPGMWVWCSLSGASANNKPTMLTLTMTGYRRNRSY